MPIDHDSWAARLAAVQDFHDKHLFRDNGGEELTYLVALMAEELGELSTCVTKDNSKYSLSKKSQTYWFCC